MINKPQFFSVSENSLTVSFSNTISLETNRQVLDLADFIEQNSFDGLNEIIPAYSSLTVFFDLGSVKKNYPDSQTAFLAVKTFLQNALENLAEREKPKSREVEILFDWRDEFALDLEFISEAKKISKEEIIEIFSSKTYRVFMLGFLPGFAYMGETDKRIAVPRKDKPRLKVPKGSVGIAGNQTGIYPLESPGGWQIIGRTETELFTPDNVQPTFFQAGDLVKFTAI